MNRFLKTIIERIVEASHPEAIILFGSMARGEDRADSDIDLLVIESAPFGPTRSRITEIGRLERAIGSIPVSTDLLVYSREEVERFRPAMNHIVSRVLKDGEVVYERP